MNMWNNLVIAFEIMGKGMAGIFAAIIIIMIAVMMMRKLAGVSNKEEQE